MLLRNLRLSRIRLISLIALRTEEYILKPLKIFILISGIFPSIFQF
jgi:hypothetical protein